MRDAIDNLLDGLTYSNDHPRPELFSFDRQDGRSGSDVTGFSTTEWDLKESRLSQPLSGWEKDRLRLWNPRDPEVEEGTTWPQLEGKLLRALGPWKPGTTLGPGKELPVGHFDPPNKPLSFCPDVVVFDDLGGSMRSIPLDFSPTWTEPEATSWRDSPKWASLSTADKNEAHSAEALDVLLARLKLAVSPDRQRGGGGPRLEPVIICSVKDKPPKLDEKVRAGTTFWGVLAGDRNLRRRTVILLDAADLREHCQFAIGSGSSWENTAQDTIAELRRSEQLRWLFEFSQVIIRFGCTGALHISRRDEREWTHQLYFDPERHDATWCNPNKDEVVLGESSLFVATVVRHLTRVCMERNEDPDLHDLAATVGEAVPSAVRACQALVHVGYGTREKPQLSEDTCFAPELFEALAEQPGAELIATATIPPTRNRTWSILSDVTHGRVGRLARDIVRFGVRSSLLQSVPLRHQFTDAYTAELSSRLSDMSATIVERESSDRTEAIEEFVEHEPNAVADSVLIRLTRLPSTRSASYVRTAITPSSFPTDKVRQLIREHIAQLQKLGGRPLRSLPAVEQEINRHLQQFETGVGQLIRREFELPASDLLYSPVAAPVYRLGKDNPAEEKPGDEKFFLDRREIEGVRDIRKLIQMHLDAVENGRDKPTSLRPLSLAVFGPPGAGKSVAVKGVIASFKDRHSVKAKILEPYNLAQFSGSKDLDQAFDTITATCATSEVPIAFFDEFDSPFQGADSGWLKFFLSPMEDGYYGGRPVHTAVFVFAGGTSPTFNEFSFENRPVTDPQVQAFGKAKGPDFVSRLKGHMDIVGVNLADLDDGLYLIRRAVVVRNILATVQGLKDEAVAEIDDSILRAILFVPNYRNGARSIRKLIEMCPGSATKVTNAALPPINQLNMVTDGKKFLDLLDNVSAENPDDRW